MRPGTLQYMSIQLKSLKLDADISMTTFMYCVRAPSRLPRMVLYE